jgi:hypothetical protein
MPIYLINTLSTFRMQYAIEAKNLEHAYDELVGSEHDRNFDEVTQKWLGEQIIDGREMSEAEVRCYVKGLQEDKSELSSYWLGDKLIHRIDYGDEDSSVLGPTS